MIEVKDTGEDRQMPAYQSHKKVWALKIAAIEFEPDGSARIAPADVGYAPFIVPGFRSRFHGGANVGDDPDLGYFVQYQGGYISWSPTTAFEEGYTRLSQ